MLAVLRGATQRGDRHIQHDALSLSSADLPLTRKPLDLGEGLDSDAGRDPRAYGRAPKAGQVGIGIDFSDEVVWVWALHSWTGKG